MIIIRKLEDYKDIEGMRKFFAESVEKITPDKIKERPIIDLSEKGEIRLKLTKELVEEYHLDEWLKNYRKEAQVSTGGIRGVQNIAYYSDTRFPIHQLGVALATLGKALVLKDTINGKAIQKIASSEVRYNSKNYVELISRIQAAQGIVTHRPFEDKLTSIWMVSFLIFTHDYDGGEYVTSSHAISRKIATKDLDNQGSQFLPEMSLAFVAKIEEIIEKAKKGSYELVLSPKDHPLIVNDFDGFDEYVEYLKQGAATKKAIALVKEMQKKGFKLMLDCVGGNMGFNAPQVLKRLEIHDAFDWCNVAEDPFFHGIGKIWEKNSKGEQTLTDLTCDASFIPVVRTMGYEKILSDMPVGYIVMITDPDGDRLITGQIEPAERIPDLKKLGIEFIELGDNRVFAVYSPNQSFFITMDYNMKALKAAGLWDDHPRFIIKTTASAIYWNIWAEANDIKLIDVPVGFKEIATVMKKVERQIEKNPKKDVKIHDVYGNLINLGIQPRMIFAGEESGGMITGPEEIIKSKKGRIALAMREKSAMEPIVIQTTLAADLFSQKKFLSEYFNEIFEKNGIVERFDLREDVRLYNENEPDPMIMKKEKAKGEILRDKIDSFFLAICFAVRDEIISLEVAKQILSEVSPKLDFSDLQHIKFVGDGTYLGFKRKFIELRKSGTDALFKIYAGGDDKAELLKWAKELARFKGERTFTFRQHIPDELADSVIDKAMKVYREFLKRT